MIFKIMFGSIAMTFFIFSFGALGSMMEFVAKQDYLNAFGSYGTWIIFSLVSYHLTKEILK